MKARSSSDVIEHAITALPSISERNASIAWVEPVRAGPMNVMGSEYSNELLRCSPVHVGYEFRAFLRSCGLIRNQLPTLFPDRISWTQRPSPFSVQYFPILPVRSS